MFPHSPNESKLPGSVVGGETYPFEVVSGTVRFPQIKHAEVAVY